MDIKDNKEIDFIASKYRKNIFDTKAALRRIKPVKGFRSYITKVAAASIVFAVVGATASILFFTDLFNSVPEQPENTATELPISPERIVKVIDFEDAPLPLVIEKIREIYGVEVTDLPHDAETYRLSLHYEGTAIDLVETINDILDLNMRVDI